jgi:DNA-directed RNA polymerase specialized sigma24 family protein
MDLGSLLQKARPRVKVLLARYRIPIPEQEAMVQEALLSLSENWSRIRDPEAWLMGSLRNKCLYIGEISAGVLDG